ncbi:MAG: polyprenyl diphosphate synthase [Candidatus Paceibacterota bacterium]|jgi:undecaprenyl diphosphate synthase
MNETASAPACVGIIMDGNRRWAKERGLPKMDGHAAGLEKAKEIIRHAFTQDVGTVVLYAFSTENWNRTPEEVGYLMELFGGALMRDLDELAREGIRVRFVGDLARLPEKLYVSAKELEEGSASATSGKTLAVALSYGGRAEILAAVNRLLAEGKQEIKEEDMNAALWSVGMQDPDLIIRTGGEKRLSGFLPWQSVYSELFFTDTLWPAFTKEEFDTILAEFAQRERRRGK